MRNQFNLPDLGILVFYVFLCIAVSVFAPILSFYIAFSLDNIDIWNVYSEIFSMHKGYSTINL